MVRKCANSWCSTTRHNDEGKLFRLDIDLGTATGRSERKTEYIWLCACCVLKMHPNVEVSGNTVRVLLTKNSGWAADSSGLSARVN